jgi:hypothetical protein
MDFLNRKIFRTNVRIWVKGEVKLNIIIIHVHAMQQVPKKMYVNN